MGACREIDWREAERIAGRRVDRRRSYATTGDGKPDPISGALVFSLVRWSDECSGCDGSGCRECGHAGRTRRAMYLPYFDETAANTQHPAPGEPT